MHLKALHTAVFILTVSLSVAPNSGGVVLAGDSFMLQPVSASAPAGEPDDINSIINQSGLSAPYVSGVTNFDSFTSSVTAEFDRSGFRNVTSGTTQPPAVINFDLGAHYILDAVAIWNVTATSGLTEFWIRISDDENFIRPTLIGEFTIEPAQSRLFESAQVRRFDPIEARYVQLLAYRNAGFPNVRINEIAFAGKVVPEPSVFGTALTASLVFLLRRRRQPN